METICIECRHLVSVLNDATLELYACAVAISEAENWEHTTYAANFAQLEYAQERADAAYVTFRAHVMAEHRTGVSTQERTIH